MRYVSFNHRGKAKYGYIVGEQVFDLGASTGFPDLKSHIANRFEALGKEPECTAQLALADITLEAVIPNPDKVLCVAVNYHESDRPTQDVPAYPVVFTRFAASQTGHDQPLLKPKVSDQFDYEGELAVIIGKPGHQIAQINAMSYVAGYSCFNDGSVRDWQKHSSQFTPGKNFIGSASFGPWMVSNDELMDPTGLDLTTKVNGEVRQLTNTRRMMFTIPWLISYLSAFTRLEPGDVIVTGTPRGFGSSLQPPKFLQAGDVVEVKIGGIGTLRNQVAEAA
ncbi:fumarylacetoacetate hydrolase family protein [Rhizobium leguminosarum]|uniref:fumarylacetoacetate hydrolase family protein n=1 Tax=Rhizobium leguminosarum TaxID=384 RepID=UPI00048BDFAD|nr:fumarylacetoacetate hydrolase family protein [Rhizobium leguminosarum]